MLLEDGEDLLGGIIQKFERYFSLEMRGDSLHYMICNLTVCAQVHSCKCRRTIPINMCYSSPYMGFPGSSVVKNSPANAGVSGLIPELGMS